MKSIAAWFTILFSMLVLTACGGGGGGGTTSTVTQAISDNPVLSDVTFDNITIADPVSYYSQVRTADTNETPNSLFFIPVNINNDGQQDYIVHYWFGQNEVGNIVTYPTPDVIVVQLSQPDGSYAVGNREVFGTDYPALGGATRKYVRGDINKDGRDDFVFAVNYEDGRDGSDWDTVTAQPSILMSTGDIGYEVVRVGTPNWGHACGITNNADGTSDVYFAGFAYGLEAFRYINGEFVDVTDEYPAEGGEWSYGAMSIDENNVTKYIVTSATVADPSASIYTVLQRGLKLFKKINNVWTEVDAYYFDADFTIEYMTWSDTLGSNSVFTVNNNRYILYGFDAFQLMEGGMSGYENDLIVAKLAASKDVSGDYFEGVTYDEDDSISVQMFQFFDFSGDELTLVSSPIVNEDIEVNFNFFDVMDITGDDYPDLVAYAYTIPHLYERLEEDGKPIVYINNTNGGLVELDINSLPDTEIGSVSTQGRLYDVDGDDIVDLLLFGHDASDVHIHISEL